MRLQALKLEHHCSRLNCLKNFLRVCCTEYKDILEQQKILSTKFDYKKLSSFLAICFKTLKMLKQNQVYDSSIFLLDLYLSFYSVVTGNSRTESSDSSLLEIFRGVSSLQKETTEQILKKFFTIKVFEGELVLPE